MKLAFPNRRDVGYALMMVLAITSVGLLALAGVLSWVVNLGKKTDRANQLYQAQSAAEGSTEKIVATMIRDFQTNGFPGVDANLGTYATMKPSSSESALWAGFSVTGNSTTDPNIAVSKLAAETYGAIKTKYNGLMGTAATYRTVSTVTKSGIAATPIGSISQDVQFAQVPAFAFCAYYADDMEIANTTSFAINGRLHANGNVYLYPTGDLTFYEHLTSSKQVLHNPHPEDYSYHTLGNIINLGECDDYVTSFYLPIGVKNTNTLLHALIDVPPVGESPTSPLGVQRFYNKADVILTVTDTNLVATSGRYNNFSVIIPVATMNSFVATNNWIYDYREGRYANFTEIDVSKLITKFASINTLLGRTMTIFYIQDIRGNNSSDFPAVRLINSQTLPGAGMTFVTPNPLYVRGHFNSGSTELGTTNTTTALRGAVVCDALTLLSSSFNDNRSWWPLGYRTAVNTTFNAGIIAGNVPTQAGYYSGGLGNLVRHLEDWGARTLNINGSFVCLYPSTIVTAPWGSYNVFNAPKTRMFRWDKNFAVYSKLPYGTPEFRAVFRDTWKTVAGK